MTRSHRLDERLGLAAGALLAPLVGVASALRKSRLFHPQGVVLVGSACALGAGEFAAIGLRLTGPVLVRFSGAWWKRREWIDVLGCAIRFGSSENELDQPQPGDQDLLLATIKLPATTPFAPLSTRFHRLLANHYFGVSPFELRGFGRCRLRMVPLSPDGPGATREARLREALRQAPIRLRLDVKPVTRADYAPAALIELTAFRPDDPELYFDPFQCGRGIEPAGFVHYLRVATYAASRGARALVRRRKPILRPARPTDGAGSPANAVQ